MDQIFVRVSRICAKMYAVILRVRSQTQNAICGRQHNNWTVILVAAICIETMTACGAPVPMPDQSPLLEGEYQDIHEPFYLDADMLFFQYSSALPHNHLDKADVRNLKESGKVVGLAMRGVLEYWTGHVAVTLENPNIDKLTADGFTKDPDGWWTKPEMMELIIERFTDGSYDILYSNQTDSDGLLAGYDSAGKAVYDWYVTENGLDLPLYQTADAVQKDTEKAEPETPEYVATLTDDVITCSYAENLKETEILLGTEILATFGESSQESVGIYNKDIIDYLGINQYVFHIWNKDLNYGDTSPVYFLKENGTMTAVRRDKTGINYKYDFLRDDNGDWEIGSTDTNSQEILSLATS